MSSADAGAATAKRAAKERVEPLPQKFSAYLCLYLRLLAWKGNAFGTDTHFTLVAPSNGTTTRTGREPASQHEVAGVTRAATGLKFWS